MDTLLQFSPNTTSFEDTYKTAYSHGLEEIYALENVDISSVKPISSPKSKQEKQKAVKKERVLDPQLKLDLGGEFRECMEAICLSESIHILQLATHIENLLLENGWQCLRDLVERDLNDLMAIKGIGLGHIDEIETKLFQHINGRELYQCDTIDFVSLATTLVASFDRKRALLFLESYDLGALITLSSVERIEVKRLTQERKQELKQEVLNQLAEKKEFVKKVMHEAMDVFIKPWMRHRFGMVTRVELMERLQRVSEDPEMTEPVLELIHSVFFDCTVCLQEVDDEIYCVDEATAQKFVQVIEKATSYFYQPHIRYTLSELVCWIKREFAKDWKGFTEGFIEKALRLSHQFRVRKGDLGTLVIRLA